MMKLQNDFLRELAEKGKRFEDRKLDEFRKISIEKGIIENAEGSARVRIGETEVIAGIKMDIGEPFPDKPDEGTLMVSAEFSPVANPEFELGPPDDESIELARIVDRGIRESGAIDTKKMCIKKGEKIWIVNIDIQILNHGGNLIDAAALASIAALTDAKFPKLDGDRIEYGKKTKKPLPLKYRPVSVTVNKTGRKLFIDANIEEEKIVDAGLVITTKDNGNVCALQKIGSGQISLEDIEKMLEIAIKKGRELRKLV